LALCRPPPPAPLPYTTRCRSCLAAGLVGAVLLTGVPPPSAAAHLPDRHGIIMTLGFLGTVIALERSVALRQPWAHAAPGLLGAGDRKSTRLNSSHVKMPYAVF